MPPLKPNPRPKSKAARSAPSARAGARLSKTRAASAPPDAAEAAWRGMYHQLLDFQRQRGHCDVPSARPYRALAAWLETQRELHSHGRLAAHRVAQLDELGLDLSAVDDADGDTARPRRPSQHHEEAWEARFAELAAFHRRFGHLRVTRGWKESTGLASWLDHQKEKRRAGTLDPERLARLDALGFSEQQRVPRAVRQTQMPEWEELWAQRVADLRTFKAKHGHCMVPVHDDSVPTLAGWVLRVRKKYRDGVLREDRRQELEAMGFSWKPLHARAEARFEKGLAQLLEFHRRHGHTRVTEAYKKQPDLWKFRHYQRQLFRQGLVPPEHKARLDALGFDWEEDAPVPRAKVEFTDPGWHAMLKKLTAFQRKFGHTRVPKEWPDAALRRWVFHQRRRLRMGKLLPERAAALKALGFEAHTKGIFEDTLWERRFQELAAFHKQHGHTRVPRPRGQDVPLHSWRFHQRKLRRLGRLAPERIARLDTLGFDWG